jgi:nucleoid-associated protein YgaU
MVQHRRNRIGFWVFVLLVALGAGWAANQEGRWPFPGWLAPSGEQGQEAEAVGQPIGVPQDSPEPARLAATEPPDREPEIGHAADRPKPAQEPAAERSAAAGDASSAPAAPAVPGNAGNPLASSQAGTRDQTGAGDLVGATGADDRTAAEDPAVTGADDQIGAEALAVTEAGDQTGAVALAVTEAGDQTRAEEQAGAASTDDSTGAKDLAAEESAAQEAGSPSETLAAGAPPVDAQATGTGSVAARGTVPGAERMVEQPGGSDMAAVPPTGDPHALGDAAAGSIEDAAEPQATAGMIGSPTAPPSAQSGSASQQSEESGGEIAAVSPGAGQGPAVEAATDATGDVATAPGIGNPDALAERAGATPEGSSGEVTAISRGDGEAPGVADASAGATGDDPAQDVAALLSDAKATAPSFDIVRVEPDGRAVIAGRAAPGAEVELRSGEEVIDRVRASRRGDWVAIPGKPLNPGDQQLSAVAALKGAPAVPSEQIVVVSVPERALPVARQASATTPQPPVAVLLPRTGRGTGRILQAPGRLSAQGTLALITVGYDQLGQMLLSGEAPPGVPVRVYIDNQPMALVVGDAKGTWSSGLDQPLQPGTYTLRLDQLNAQGQTVARIETPITRVSEPPIEGELQVDYVVVQPGNSLWRIARRLTGRGVDYVYIYDSNHAQIRDPDLIFPGQVFQIPPEVGTAG